MDAARHLEVPALSGRWLVDFTCANCAESGPGCALVAPGGVTVCFECAWDALLAAAEAADSRPIRRTA